MKVTQKKKVGRAPVTAEPVANKGRSPSAGSPQRPVVAGCVCGGGCPRCQREKSPRPTVQLGREDAIEERQANLRAREVMSRQPPAPPPELRGSGPHSASHPILTRGGAALPTSTRAFFEPRFGRDLGHVRVHGGEVASRLTRSLGARAFAYADHIWLGPNVSSGPSTIMAHELAHVAQHAVDPQPVIRRTPCGHDGGTPSCGRFGRINPFGDNEAVDTLVLADLDVSTNEDWATEVHSPPNPFKAGPARGRIDGVTIPPSGSVLAIRIAEVKPCSAAWGCTVATQEATGYRLVLEAIRDRILRVSRAAFRAGGMGTPSRLTAGQRAELAAEGINTASASDQHAIRFFSKLLAELGRPLVLRNYAGITIGLYAASHGNDREALDWPEECADGGTGVGRLIYQMNQQGGISYRCEVECEEQDEDEQQDAVADQPEETEEDVETRPEFRPWAIPGEERRPPGSPRRRRRRPRIRREPLQTRRPRPRPRPPVRTPSPRRPQVRRPRPPRRRPSERPQTPTPTPTPEAPVEAPLERITHRPGFDQVLRPLGGSLRDVRVPPGDYTLVTSEQVGTAVEQLEVQRRVRPLQPRAPHPVIAAPEELVGVVLLVGAAALLITAAGAAMAPAPGGRPAAVWLGLAAGTTAVLGIAYIVHESQLDDARDAIASNEGQPIALVRGRLPLGRLQVSGEPPRYAFGYVRA